MTFLELFQSEFASPKADYNWTVERLVECINKYISKNLESNLNTPIFGLTGTFISNSGISTPYIVSPGSNTTLCPGYKSYTPGEVTVEEYKDIIGVSCKSNRSPKLFWKKFFELLAMAIMRIEITIKPFTASTIVNGGSSRSASALKEKSERTKSYGQTTYNYDTLVGTSLYQKTRTGYTAKAVKDTCNTIAEKLYSNINHKSIKKPDTLWEIVSNYIKTASTDATYIWRYYTSSSVIIEGVTGTYTGYIYGSLTFD